MVLDSAIKILELDEIRAKYEKLARWYDVQDIPYEVMCVNRLRSNLIPKATGEVLEVAVGTGKNLRYYPQNTKIVAVDYSPAMLKQAQKKAKRCNRQVDFQIMDAENLAFPNESFDTVVSTLTGCTFPHPEKAYAEMARVCRPNGRILLMEHGRSSASWLGWIQDRLAKPYYHQYACLWNRNALKSIQDSGLEIIQSQTALLGVFYAIEAKKRF